MRKFLPLLALILFALPARASIANIYYRDISAGGNTGADCADAYAYNDATHGWTVAGNWGAGASQIGAGTTIHVCPGSGTGGAWTFSAGATGILVQGSGSSGNYITITADQGNVIWQAPYFGVGAPFGGCGPASVCGAAIEIYNENFVIIDGDNQNWHIKNTADGTSLAHQVGSMHVYGQGDHIIVRGLLSDNLYINGGSNTGAGDTGGNGAVNIYFNSASTNLAIYNNVLNSSRIGISADYSGTTGPNSCPTPTGAIGISSTNLPTLNLASNWGICVFNNTLSDHAWQMQVSGPNDANIFSNEWGDNTVSYASSLPGWLNWQFPTGTYHQNGLFAYNSSSGTTAAMVYAYDNWSHGDLGNGSPTGHMSCNSGTNGGCAMTAFNNIIVQTGSSQWPGDASNDQDFSTCPSSNGTSGPYVYYNNTLVGGAFAIQIYTGGVCGSSTADSYTWENNVWDLGSGWYDNESNGGNIMTVGTINNNDYFGASAATGWWQLNASNTSKTLAAWQGVCTCDAASVLQTPNLAGNYAPNTGSPAINLGANLTSVSITALDSDIYGNARPASGSWTAGAVNPAAGAQLSAPCAACFVENRP